MYGLTIELVVIQVDIFCRYLLENQLSGPSSVAAYIDVLNKGCKCVECKCNANMQWQSQFF